MKTSKLTPMDKAIIGLINLSIRHGASRQEIIAEFDRTDVSRKSNYNLVKKYQSLYMNNEIDKEKMKANEINKLRTDTNDISKSVFEYLGVSEQLKTKQ